MTKTREILKADANTIKNNIDASYCLPAKDYTTLQDAAYQDFSQNGSEGKTHRIYLDSKGNPTVGVGHLIMPKKGLNNKKTEETYRQKYLKLDLRDSKGNPLSNEEKISQFNSILAAMKNKNFKTSGGCPNYINSPAVGKLSEAGVKQSFCSDYDYWYSRVKNKFPDLDNYPLSLQLSLTHCGFAGALNKVKNKGEMVDIAKQVAKVRSGKHCSYKETQMAQAAVRQCQYLANSGLNPLNSTRENMLTALNVSEPSFSTDYNEMFKDIPEEQREQKITEYENQDNVNQGSVLRGLVSDEANEGDLVGAMFYKALIEAIKSSFCLDENKNSGVVADMAEPKYIIDTSGRYQINVSDFDVKSENFARDLARQLSENIKNGYKGYCHGKQPYCAGAGTGTLNQAAKNYEFFDMGVKGTGCIAVRDQFAKLYGSKGATSNCYEELKKKIDANPQVPQVFALTVKSSKSPSGLHYVTVAPRLDKDGEIVRDENGAVQYNVYGFNSNINMPIEKYSLLKRAGNVFPITEMANRQYELAQEKNNNVNRVLNQARQGMRV